jgi:hypothetical protein
MDPYWVQSIYIAIAVVCLLVVVRINVAGLITYGYSRSIFEKQLRELYSMQLALNLFCANGESQRKARRLDLFKGSMEKSYDELRNEMLKHTTRLPLRYIRRGGRFLWLYSDEYVVEIGDRREVLVVGPVLWDNITAGVAERSELTFKQWQKIIRHRKISQQTWTYFFKDHSPVDTLMRYDFVNAVEQFINDRTRTASNLKSWESMAGVIVRIIDVFFWIGMVSKVLLISYVQSLRSVVLS